MLRVWLSGFRKGGGLEAGNLKGQSSFGFPASSALAHSLTYRITDLGLLPSEGPTIPSCSIWSLSYSFRSAVLADRKLASRKAWFSGLLLCEAARVLRSRAPQSGFRKGEGSGGEKLKGLNPLGFSPPGVIVRHTLTESPTWVYCRRRVRRYRPAPSGPRSGRRG